MNCEHERLRTVGDRVFCCSCGEELPLSFLTDRKAPAATCCAPSTRKGVEVPEEIPEEKPAKTPAKKKTAKAAR